MERDYKLIFDVEHLCDAESVHEISNAVSAYHSAIVMQNETGDVEFTKIAVEAERQLRILLTRLRFKNEAERKAGIHG